MPQGERKQPHRMERARGPSTLGLCGVLHWAGHWALCCSSLKIFPKMSDIIRTASSLLSDYIDYAMKYHSLLAMIAKSNAQEIPVSKGDILGFISTLRANASSTQSLYILQETVDPQSTKW